MLHLAALDSFHYGIFQYVNMPVYLTWPWVFGLLAVFCSYEWLFSEHSSDSQMHKCRSFFWVYA